MSHFRYILDPGHGPLTRGKRSPRIAGEIRFLEYEFNRDIVRRIVKRIELEGIDLDYFITMSEDECCDDALETRVERANAWQKQYRNTVFISIHSNAAPVKETDTWAPGSISGVETWHYSPVSSMARRLAATLQLHIVKTTGMKDRGLKSKTEGQFYVLRNTTMPAVLTENGFYNNRPECLNLMKDEVRQKIADGHLAAMLEFDRYYKRMAQ